MIKALKRLFTRSAVTSFAPADDRIPAFITGGSNSTALGATVTPATALTLADYYAAIRNISEDVGKLPFKVYRQLKPRGKEVVSEHPVHRLLHVSPNPEMTPIAFRETVTHWALGWGNGYAEIERNNAGTPINLWPIHPNRVRLVRQDGELFGEITLDSGGTGVLPYADMLHIKGLGNGYLGYSVVQLAAESIGHDQALERFGAAFFGNGASIGTIFRFPHAMSPKARQDFKEAIQEQREGLSNAHKSLTLENGGDVTRTSIPPEEAQFIESRHLMVEVMCRWFRIPPHKVQHLLRATFTNIESQAREYVGDTLMPWLVRWEQEVGRKLFSPNSAGLFAEHSVNALLRGESDKRAAFFSTLIQIGMMTPNEGRDLEGMNPIEGGDIPMVQGALVPLLEAQKAKERPAAQRGTEGGSGPSRVQRVADIGSAFVPMLESALMRVHRMAAGKYVTGNWSAQMEQRVAPIVESMNIAIAAGIGATPLTFGELRAAIGAMTAHYLECARHRENSGEPGHVDAWLARQAMAEAELAAGAIFNGIEAAMN